MARDCSHDERGGISVYLCMFIYIYLFIIYGYTHISISIYGIHIDIHINTYIKTYINLYINIMYIYIYMCVCVSMVEYSDAAVETHKHFRGLVALCLGTFLCWQNRNKSFPDCVLR